MVQISIFPDSKCMEQLILLDKLRRIRKERRLQFTLLQTSISKFLSMHACLYNQREHLRKDKIMTRKQRAKMLDEIIALEQNLLLLRQAIISGSLLLCQLCFQEIENFINLFEPQQVGRNEVKSKRKPDKIKESLEVDSPKVLKSRTSLYSSSKTRNMRDGMFAKMEMQEEIKKNKRDFEKNFYQFVFRPSEYSREFPALPQIAHAVEDDTLPNSRQPGWQRFVGIATEFEFILSAQRAVAWYRDSMLPWINDHARGWKEEHFSDFVVSFQRLQILQEKSSDVAAARKTAVKSCILDEKELLLSMSEVVMTIYDPSVQKTHCIDLSAELLDEVIGKHPSSPCASLLWRLGYLKADRNNVYKKLMNSHEQFSSLLPLSSPSKTKLEGVDMFKAIESSRSDYVASNLAGGLSKLNAKQLYLPFHGPFESAICQREALLDSWSCKPARKQNDAIENDLLGSFSTFSVALEVTKKELLEFQEITNSLLNSENPYIFLQESSTEEVSAIFNKSKLHFF